MGDRTQNIVLELTNLLVFKAWWHAREEWAQDPMGITTNWGALRELAWDAMINYVPPTPIQVAMAVYQEDEQQALARLVETTPGDAAPMLELIETVWTILRRFIATDNSRDNLDGASFIVITRRALEREMVGRAALVEPCLAVHTPLERGQRSLRENWCRLTTCAGRMPHISRLSDVALYYNDDARNSNAGAKTRKVLARDRGTDRGKFVIDSDLVLGASHTSVARSWLDGLYRYPVGPNHYRRLPEDLTPDQVELRRRVITRAEGLLTESMEHLYRGRPVPLEEDDMQPSADEAFADVVSVVSVLDTIQDSSQDDSDE